MMIIIANNLINDCTSSAVDNVGLFSCAYNVACSNHMLLILVTAAVVKQRF